MKHCTDDPLPESCDASSAATTVLLVDEEPRSIQAVRRTLEDEFEVMAAASPEEARALLERHEIDVILCDQRLPGQSGVEFLKEVRTRWPDTVRIVISGYAHSEAVVMQLTDSGIHQIVLKPWAPDHLLRAVRQASEMRALSQDVQRLDHELHASAPRRDKRSRAPAREGFDFSRLARAPGSPLDALCSMAERLARVDLSVLITGESGTGKELLARAMHGASPRAGGPFVVENCAAIPDTLLESELFGHKRGAFTGAVEDHVGLFQRAHGGTVFLDEIGETSPAFQVKLLRVLQEGELRPVGSARAVPVDVRVLSATHRDLEVEVRAGRFREDLYYRLAGVTLHMPPLRERSADIGPIAERVLADVAAETGHRGASLAPGTLACLLAYPWPGNIRELRNELARALALADGQVIEPAVLSSKVLRGPSAAEAQAIHATLPQHGSLAERLDALEATILRETMLRHRWNKSSAAKELMLSRMGLRAKLIRFGMVDGVSDAHKPH